MGVGVVLGSPFAVSDLLSGPLEVPELEGAVFRASEHHLLCGVEGYRPHTVKVTGRREQDIQCMTVELILHTGEKCSRC